jgi:hypothetical protein
MNDFVNVGIILLASITHASLQLDLGCLLLLHHESAGKHIRTKTRKLVSSFVFGVGTIVFLLLAAACFVVDTLFRGTLPPVTLSIAVGVLAALAIAMWFFYYRRGATTELWLPKPVTKFINGRAKVTGSNTEAFSLGVLTNLAEMPFIAILLLAAANSILNSDPAHQVPLAIIYAIIATAPLIIFRIAIRTGRNVVDIQKWRVKNKLFLRILSGCGFLILGSYILAFKILGAI